MTGRSGRRDPVPAGATGPKPLVAIVGRPNVGKSTLFNRLAGRRIAIVEDVPGVTRDRHYADADALGRPYVVIDTGGFDPDSDDPMTDAIAAQVELAVAEADLILCLLDATCDPTPADRKAVQLLREADKPVLYLANKADSPAREALALSLYELGLDNILPVSAQHGRHMGALEQAVATALPKGRNADQEVPAGYQDAKRVAIVGRPNAGKSSFVNRLLGEERLVVDNRPGTTVDSVDTFVQREGAPLVLIDTAGMRKKSRVQRVRGVEGLAVIHAIRAMERSHAALLLIDAVRGPSEQDVKIAALAQERGRALVIGLNKMDQFQGNEDGRKAVFSRARELLRGVPWAPILSLSVKSGRGVQKVMQGLDAALVEHNKRVGTSEINRFFDEVLDKHPPPTAGNRSVRLFYVTQAEVRPPTFVVMTNLPDDVHWSYRKYVENQIRERFGFMGTALRVRWRARRKAELT